MSGAAPPADPRHRILIARGLRDFGDGFSAVLLPVYLIMLGLGPLAIGLVATVALFGSAMMTLGIGLIGARIEQAIPAHTAPDARRALCASCHPRAMLLDRSIKIGVSGEMHSVAERASVAPLPRSRPHHYC